MPPFKLLQIMASQPNPPQEIAAGLIKGWLTVGFP